MQQGKINYQGILGLTLIGIMFLSIFLLQSNTKWPFLIAAVILYAIAIVSTTLIKEQLQRQNLQVQQQQVNPNYQKIYNSRIFQVDRAAICCHSAFILLIIGLYISSTILKNSDPSTLVGLFLACLAGGIVIPYTIYRQ